MSVDPIQALQAAVRPLRAAAAAPVMLVAGATGTLGNEVLRRLAGTQRIAAVATLASHVPDVSLLPLLKLLQVPAWGLHAQVRLFLFFFVLSFLLRFLTIFIPSIFMTFSIAFFGVVQRLILTMRSLVPHDPFSLMGRFTLCENRSFLSHILPNTLNSLTGVNSPFSRNLQLLV